MSQEPPTNGGFCEMGRVVVQPVVCPVVLADFSFPDSRLDDVRVGCT